ncbi:endo alpha-1,4 polygalactosaminidase [Marinobacter sp. V034]|uniref:endo alpha-1,4 polygalactosaminidase n=1 Tax=Marinobacter sp. V034 TaxID=3459610 RepID=UPI004044B85D
MIRLFLSILVSLVFYSGASHASQPENIGFYYGNEAPVASLMAYDWLVLQPDRVSASRLDDLRRAGTVPLAYISLGEIARDHKQYRQAPAKGLLEENKAWRSRVFDLRREDVQRFIIDQLVEPAFKAGFNGVFLDTLDSFQLTEAGRAEPEAFAAAQQQIIEKIRNAHPKAHILVNRGFQLPDAARALVDGVVVESYRRGYNPDKKRYTRVSDSDRAWLDQQFDKWRQIRPDIPFIAIDYIEEDKDADALARQLRSDGFIPYVSDPDLLRLGPTQPSRVKRQILVFHDAPSGQLIQSTAHIQGGVLLDELGYIPHYRSTQAPLPKEPATDRFAGIVVWWETAGQSNRLCNWLIRQQQAGLPVVVLGQVPGDRSCKQLIGAGALGTPSGQLDSKPLQPSFANYESRRLPAADGSSLPQVDIGTVTPWATITDSKNIEFTPVYTFSGGGVALTPYLFEPGPDDQKYWLFNPITFMAEALSKPSFPAIDVTTETGRIILTSHIDGDGFVSRGEFPGAPLGAEVIEDKILKAYPVAHTVSIIEAETSPKGIYPSTSAEAEPVARSIFRLPQVEVASHSYSHPFFWNLLEDGPKKLPKFADYGYSLDIPGYTPKLETEIAGSVAYINKLAPPSKPVKVFLWTGDAFPGVNALRQVREADLLNVNGGNTHPLKYESELAGVWPVARPVGDELQIYAPVMNENLYTNLWHGPYYGFRDVIDTFNILERLGRLKPISIYYHFYSGTKPSALHALQEIYDYALSRPVTSLFLSQYAVRAETAYRSVLMRADDGRYQWRGIGQPHTVRIDLDQYPDLDASLGVAGYKDDAGKRFVHLTGASPQLKLTDRPPSAPYLRSANAVLTRWTREQEGSQWTISMGFEGHQPLDITMAAKRCRVKRGPAMKITTAADGVHLSTTAQRVDRLDLECQ